MAQRADAAGIAAYDGVYGTAFSAVYPLKSGSISAAIVYNELSFAKAATPSGADLNYNALIALNYVYTLSSEMPVYEEKGAIAATLKANRLSSKNDGEADFFSADIGGHYNVYKALWAFAALKNIGGAAQIGNAPSFPMPATFNFALRCDMPFEAKIALTADIVKFLNKDYGDFGGGFGAEFSPVYPATFRLGWRKYGDNLNEGPTFGIFLDFGNFSFGYSFASMAQGIYPKHTVNLGFMFGNIKNQSKAFDYWLGYNFNIAKQYYVRKDYINARQQFENILSIYPNHAPSKDYLSKIVYDLDMNDRIFENQISRWLRRADLEFFRNNLIPAKNYYQKVLGMDPENEEAAAGLEKIEDRVVFIESDDNKKKYGKEIISLWNDAVSLYQKGDFAYAKDKFKKILLVDSQHSGAKRYLDNIDSRLGKVTSAQADTFYNQGLEYYNMADYESAARYFNAAYVQDSGRTDAKEYYELSKKLAASSGKTSSSGAGSSGSQGWASTQKIQKEIEADYGEALKLYNQTKYDEALKAFVAVKEKTVKHNYRGLNDSIRDYTQRARTAISARLYREALPLMQKKDYENAYEKFSKALEYDPQNFEAQREMSKVSSAISQRYYDEGMKSYAAGDKNKAIQSFELSLKYNPQNAAASKVLEKIKIIGN
ncbi:MAG: hypothetical protein LBU09_05300 [Endomicrobium sp.]|nr:hypothetical protein [Endomicrobium sp.]